MAAHEDLREAHGKTMDPNDWEELKLRTFHGVEIVDQVTRLCAMNLMLHGVGPTANEGRSPPSHRGPPPRLGVKAEGLSDSAHLPEPGALAEEMIKDLKTATAQFEQTVLELNSDRR